MANEYTYLGPLEETGFERLGDLSVTEPNYAQRVGARIADIPGRVATGVVEGIPELVTGGGQGRIAGGLKALGALGALFEPLMAPVGEAGRAAGRYAGEAYLKTGVLPGVEGFAPEPMDVSKVTPEEAQAIREGAGSAYALGAEAAVGFGRPLANLGVRVPGLFANKITPIGQKMIDIMGYGSVRLAKVTKSPFMDFWDNVAEKAIFGGGRIAKFQEKGTKLIENFADDFAHAMGAQVKDPVMRGSLLKEIVDGSDEAYRAAGSQLYKQVDLLHPEPAVNMRPVHDLIRRLRAEFPEGTEAGGLLKTIEAQIAPTVSPPTVHPIMSILTGGIPGAPTVKPAVKTFLEANDLRGWAYSWQTPGLSSASDQAVRVGTLVGKELDRAIDTAGKVVSPQARAQLQVARNYWREEAATFNRRAVRRILNDANLPPEKVVETFLKPGAITEVRAFQKMVGGQDSSAWGTVRRAWVEDLFNKAHKIDAQTGRMALDGKALHTELTRWGDESATAILGQNHAKNLKDLAEVIVGQQAMAGGGGGMAIQLQQSGAVIKTAQALGTLGAATVSPGLAAGILVGPRVLSQIFTSPRVTKALIEGLKLHPGSPGAIRNAAVISNFLQPGRRQDKEPTSSELESMFFGRGAK